MYTLNINHNEPQDLEDIGYMVGPIAARLCQLARIVNPDTKMPDPKLQLAEMTRQINEHGYRWDKVDSVHSVLTQWVLKMWPSLLIHFYLGYKERTIILHVDNMSIIIPVPAAVVSDYLDDELAAIQ